MRFIFTKVARHRVFQHDPIYFDPKKEERQERERRIKEELGLLSEEEKETGYADRIRGGMRRRIKSNYEVSRSTRRRSNLRLIVILIVLMVIGLYLAKSGLEWFNSYVAG